MEIFPCKEIEGEARLKSRKAVVAAIIGGVVNYLEEEHTVVPSIPRRKPETASSSWVSSGRKEIMQMRMLWQRRTVPKHIAFGSPAQTAL